MELSELVQAQRLYFQSGATRPLSFRLTALKALQQAIVAREEDILTALKSDLNKSPCEGYMTEVGMVLSELRFVLHHLKRWAKEERVKTPLTQFPSKSFVVKEPYGVVLIMSPWNYPFQLCLEPLIGALAAGNCAIVKPSNYAPATSKIIHALIRDCFDAQYVTTVLGGRQENADLLQQKFDYLFFTGGPGVGRLVMESAARHLTPVTLELGGKSPCIVDESANLPLAARRIVFGKFLNAGQTCVAPDYLLVQQSVKKALLSELKKAVRASFGEYPLKNADYPKIINQKHFDRLLSLLKGEDLAFGGQFCADTLQIAPTLIKNVTFDSAIMQEEIFGPLLPVMTFSTLDEVIQTLLPRPKPLALYLFTTRKSAEERVLSSLSFGGGCINDTIIHLATSAMGFGGVGESGMGSYHGKKSFDTFTHEKSVVKKSNRIDVPLRYPPYDHKKLSLLKKIMK